MVHIMTTWLERAVQSIHGFCTIVFGLLTNRTRTKLDEQQNQALTTYF
jgi:hypothetical protein